MYDVDVLLVKILTCSTIGVFHYRLLTIRCNLGGSSLVRVVLSNRLRYSLHGLQLLVSIVTIRSMISIQYANYKQVFIISGARIRPWCLAYTSMQSIDSPS